MWAITQEERDRLWQKHIGWVEWRLPPEIDEGTRRAGGEAPRVVSLVVEYALEGL